MAVGAARGGHVIRAAWGLLSTFAMPLFLTVLSVPLLGESVGWRRAAAVGFGGVPIIVQPGADLNWIALVALGGAFFYAMAVVAIRQLSRKEPASRIFFIYAVANIVVAGAAMPFVWVTPSLQDWLVFVAVGALGAIAQYAFLIAYRQAPAMVLVPFDYTQILFALAIGYFAWGEIPASASFLGGAIIIASGFLSGGGSGGSREFRRQ